MNKEITNYIQKRYQRWLDYAKFHCSTAGIPDEANDVMNEVILALLEKDEDRIQALYDMQRKQYRELDFYVLRMLKLNIYSETSPYQSRYKRMQYDENIELTDLDLEEGEESYNDRSAEILDQVHQVRDVISKMNLTPKARQIFDYHFFHGQPFSQWQGNDNKKDLYDTYNRIVGLIRNQLSGGTLI